MLNFAEQTGSGAVMLVWSFPQSSQIYNYTTIHIQLKNTSFVYYLTTLHKVPYLYQYDSCVTELPQHTQQQETWKGGGKQSRFLASFIFRIATKVMLSVFLTPTLKIFINFMNTTVLNGLQITLLSTMMGKRLENTKSLTMMLQFIISPIQYTADNPFYLIINNAMQPGWSKAPDPSLKYHALVVDWIKVEKK